MPAAASARIAAAMIAATPAPLNALPTLLGSSSTSSLDDLAAPLAVGDRQHGLRLHLDHMAVSVLLRPVPIQRVAVQIQGDGLPLHLDPVPAVLLAGDVLAQLDRLPAGGVPDRPFLIRLFLLACIRHPEAMFRVLYSLQFNRRCPLIVH